MFKFAVIQISLILGLALASGYQVPDLTQANWDTALFLTPSGIVTNYLQRDATVMWSFYGDPSAGQMNFSPLQKSLLAAIYLGLATSSFFFLRKAENRQ